MLPLLVVLAVAPANEAVAVCIRASHVTATCVFALCSKEKEEYEENILRDLHSLDVKWCMVTHTSDYFDLIEETARKLIREGKAFMDDTPREEMQAERTAMKDSQHR